MGRPTVYRPPNIRHHKPKVAPATVENDCLVDVKPAVLVSCGRDAFVTIGNKSNSWIHAMCDASGGGAPVDKSKDGKLKISKKKMADLVGRVVVVTIKINATSTDGNWHGSEIVVQIPVKASNEVFTKVIDFNPAGEREMTISTTMQGASIRRHAWTRFTVSEKKSKKYTAEKYFG